MNPTRNTSRWEPVNGFLACRKIGDSGYNLFLFLQQGRKGGEGTVTRCGATVITGPDLTVGIGHAVPFMLIVMTVEAEQFPVAAVGRIIIMVMILVVHREFVELLSTELTGAPGAYPREHLEGLLTIPHLALLPAPLGLGNDPGFFFGIIR